MSIEQSESPENVTEESTDVDIPNAVLVHRHGDRVEVETLGDVTVFEAPTLLRLAANLVDAKVGVTNQ